MQATKDRRQTIAQALLRLVAQGGIEAVSLRTVAQEAGYSLGMIQRQFPSKDQLLHFALQYSVQQLEQRLHQRLLNSQTMSAKAALHNILIELSSTQDEARAETIIWLSYLSHAVTTPSFRPQLEQHYQPARQGIAEIIIWGQNQGELSRELEPQTTASSLLALSDGLVIQNLTGIISPDTTKAVVEQQIAVLLA